MLLSSVFVVMRRTKDPGLTGSLCHFYPRRCQLFRYFLRKISCVAALDGQKSSVPGKIGLLGQEIRNSVNFPHFDVLASFWNSDDIRMLLHPLCRPSSHHQLRLAITNMAPSAVASSSTQAAPAVKRTSPTALRALSAELGTLARADASASFSFGPIIVVASVSGPVEVRIRDELTDRATLDVIFQPQHGVAGIPSQAVSDSLFTAFSSVLLLHHHPRSLIQVVLQTLSSPTLPQSSGQAIHSGTSSQRHVARQPLLLGPDNPPSVSEQAALINAASLALLDAGIPARGTVAACACAILPKAQGTVLRQNSHLAEVGESQLSGLVRQYKEENGEADDIEVDGATSGKRYTGE